VAKARAKRVDLKDALKIEPGNIAQICKEVDDPELARVAEFMSQDAYIAQHGCQQLIKVVVPEMAHRLRTAMHGRYQEND